MNSDEKINIVFDAILAKNQLAREIKHGYIRKGYTYPRLEEIEKALALSMELLGVRDNQPSVKEILESKYDV